MAGTGDDGAAAAELGGSIPHGGQPKPGAGLRWQAAAVVGHLKLQLGGVGQADDALAGFGVADRVGEGFAGNTVGGQVDGGWQLAELVRCLEQDAGRAVGEPADLLLQRTE
jgi:hypothetical protein